MSKKRNFQCMLEPTWISAETENIGKINFNHKKLKNVPSIMKLLEGLKKLSVYFQNDDDDQKLYPFVV